MTDTLPIRVLLVGVDRSGLELTRQLLSDADANGYEILPIETLDAARRALTGGAFDVALVDDRLGVESGVELIREAVTGGCTRPLILIACADGRAIHLEAIDAGAADSLDIADVSSRSLDRSIRYAVRDAQRTDLIRSREERSRALMTNSSDVIMVLDASGRVTFISDSIRTVGGLEPSELVGRSAWYRVHPQDVALLQGQFARCLEVPNEPCRAEYRARHGDGTWRYREAVGVNRLADPVVAGVVVNFRDVTERKRVELQREHLATIVRTSQAPIIGVTIDGTVTSWNPAAQQLFGYTDGEMLGRPITKIIPLGNRQSTLARLSRLGAGERVDDYEVDRIRKDGSIVTVSIALSPMSDHNGVVGASAVIRDVTAKRAVERALSESEERMRFALAAAQIGVWDTDLITGAVTWSESMAAAAGCPVDAFPRSYGEFLALVDAEDRDALQQAVERAVRTESQVFEVDYRMRAADGSLRWHSCKGRVFADDHGVPQRLLGVAVDITERKQLEQQFHHAQKMEAVGLLAGGIAHDFNNLLTAILGYSELALGALAPDSELRPDIEEVRKAAQSAAALTKQLLAFSRRQILQPRVLDLNAVVRHIESMVRRIIGEDVELAVQCGSPLARISADQGQLEQVIVNLAVNARDAMHAGGRLTIETANVELEQPFVSRHRGSKVGPHVMLAVSDTGVGMSEEIQKRLFEPFFTTKDRGKGTGLGLATVYGIVKQSGGSIWVYSEVGKGTTFKIYLPVATTTEEPTHLESDDTVPTGGSETVLVVEDQAEVRAITCSILRRAGYDVLEADGGVAALGISRAHRGKIDVLLTDVVMPGMGGRQLAEAVSAERPGIRVLYTSGYTDRVIVNQGLLEPGVEFIQKPFTPVRLLQRLRQVLAPASAC